MNILKSRYMGKKQSEFSYVLEKKILFITTDIL